MIQEKNRLDLEALHFHTKVREGYQKVMQRFPERFHTIDASKKKELVIQDALQVINEALKKFSCDLFLISCYNECNDNVLSNLKGA